MRDLYNFWLFDYVHLKNEVWQTRVMKQKGESFPGHKDTSNEYTTFHIYSWWQPQRPLIKVPHFPSPDTTQLEIHTGSAEGVGSPAPLSDECGFLMVKGRIIFLVQKSIRTPREKWSFLPLEDICSPPFSSFLRELPQCLGSWGGFCTLERADAKESCWPRPKGNGTIWEKAEGGIKAVQFDFEG